MAAPTLFDTTRWTLVRDAARGGDTLAVEALGALVRTYWQPLNRYSRRKGKTPENAEDLVQGFLAHVIEARALRETDHSKGRSARSAGRTIHGGAGFLTCRESGKSAGGWKKFQATAV